MPIAFREILYSNLNGCQQEAYNFQKLSGVLADFGFITIPLSNDWNGADFLAQLPDGITFLKVQLKSRLTFAKKYCGKQLHVCFRDSGGGSDSWYMYDHDELLEQVPKIKESETWRLGKPYHFPTLSQDLKDLLKPYLIPRLSPVRSVGVEGI